MEDRYPIEIRDHLMVSLIKSNDLSELRVEADNYQPKGRWRVDHHEARLGIIRIRATREGWRKAYRIARVMIKHGKAILAMDHGKIEITLPASITISPALNAV